MKYMTAEKMRRIDNLAQTKFSIPSLILMENAGRAAAEEITKFLNNDFSRKIAIFCGKGNNGGDGFVAARHLTSAGIKVDVFVLAKIQDIKKPDPLTNLKIIRKMGINLVELIDIKSIKRLRRRFNYSLIVDAIFGTGFSGKLPAHIANLVNFLNRTGLSIFSLDVPSGLDATTGKVSDVCVKATKTITFGLAKTGFIKADGPTFTGEVIVRNITYPRSLLRGRTDR